MRRRKHTNLFPRLSLGSHWLCAQDETAAGHKNFSKALNNTGRPMAFELCRGDYEKMPNWGYADSVAQLWRADGDHVKW